VTGQDGSYLAELLLAKGYKVYGVVRRSSTESNERIHHLGALQLVQADLLDQSSINDVMHEVDPDEVYNLAAQSFVPTSWSQPVYTGEVTALGVTRVLEAIKLAAPDARFYQASSSEMFGKVVETPQKESTPFYPRSPYGVAKVYGHYITVNYRESYGLHASSGILFNHESERRGLEFVTRKITNHVALQGTGMTEKPLRLGNLEAARDWGHAADYVEAMWMMLQADEPDDYVIASGHTHKVRTFVELAYEAAGFELVWKGQGLEEKGYSKRDGTQPLVEIAKEFFRPAEVQVLKGDPTKARDKLGWEPKHDLSDLVRKMVEADIERATWGNSRE
jgi:GDPmannose 4,6-dehydratase